MTAEFPATPDLEYLRKQAKELLRAVRDGESEALRRLREALPRMTAVSDEEVATGAKLADAQHAVAREYEFDSWAALRRAVEVRAPLETQAERLLAAIRAEDHSRALRIAESHPAVATIGLECAVLFGDVDRAKTALAGDASLAISEDEGGWTPLLYACASPFAANGSAEGVAACVELLLDRGADPNAFTLVDQSDPNSRLPALFRACVSNQPLVVRQLLDRGAEPNDGESVYHAAELDHEECLELLLAHGADLSRSHPYWGNTPLYFLTSYEEGHAGVARGMRWLLEHGADPNVASQESEETPLHRVAEQLGTPTAALLIEHGAEVDRPRADGRTPYVLALRSGNLAVAELLLEHGADPARVGRVDAFLGACLRADEPAARAILADKPDIVAGLTEDERRALGWAVQRDREASVRLMVDLGFDLTWEVPYGGTPLHWASWHGKPEMVELLIELGAPLEERDGQYGSTPLGWAAHGSHFCRSADDDYCRVVAALLAAGADPDVTNRWGEPLGAVASRRVAALLR